MSLPLWLVNDSMRVIASRILLVMRRVPPIAWSDADILRALVRLDLHEGPGPKGNDIDPAKEHLRDLGNPRFDGANASYRDALEKLLAAGLVRRKNLQGVEFYWVAPWTRP